MTELYLHGKKIKNVFQLLGEKENDMTASVGWLLKTCPKFLQKFLKRIKINISNAEIKDVKILLQAHRSQHGITDIEIKFKSLFHIIVEAKRGWNLPSLTQLKKYNSLLNKERGVKIKKLIILSDCSEHWIKSNLTKKLKIIYIDSIAWKELFTIAKKAAANSSHAAKRLIKEFKNYLNKIINMQNQESNWVFVVSLSHEFPNNGEISFIDVVEKKRKYFHPIGYRGFPKEPPNYIAFRYNGRLQSIHHIEGYEVTSNLHEKISEIKNKKEKNPLFIYTLGKSLNPNKIGTGRIFRSGHVWCMLDTLFTSKTIAEARNLSQKREKHFTND